MPDGIFLTPVSGLHYVIHIFDQACSILDLAPMDAEVKISSVQEAVRHHDDRLAYLENRHGSLSAHHDLKQAAHAEFSDWMLNKSEEDWVTITGLPRLSCGRREWPDAARKQVNKLVQQVLDINQANLEGRILFVNNPIPHRTTGMTVYNVQLSSLEAAKGLRGLFSGFFKHSGPKKLPTSLRGISVRNKVTLATRVRISILHQLGVGFTARNPGGSYKVHGYKSRPLLVTIPARQSSGTARQQTYNFIEAVKSLPAAKVSFA